MRANYGKLTSRRQIKIERGRAKRNKERKRERDRLREEKRRIRVKWEILREGGE